MACLLQYEGGEQCKICGHVLQTLPVTIEHSRASPSEILPGFLYLGDYNHASSCSLLKAIGITHILCVRLSSANSANPEHKANTGALRRITWWTEKDSAFYECAKFSAVTGVDRRLSESLRAAKLLSISNKIAAGQLSFLRAPTDSGTVTGSAKLPIPLQILILLPQSLC